VPVTNSGSVDSATVVQLYIRDVLGSVDRPNKRLKGFSKVMIPAGQTVDVSVSVNNAAYAVCGRAGSVSGLYGRELGG